MMNLIPLKADLVLENYINHDGYNNHVIANEIYTIKDVIYNWEHYSDDKKFRTISKYYILRNSIKDVYKIVNLSLNKEFSKLVDIPTKMETESIDSKGYDDNFQWWYTYNRVHYICLASNSINIKDKNYSREELIELINTNQILPVNNYLERIDKISQDREKYKYIRLLLSYGIDVSEPLIAMNNNGEYMKDDNNNLILEDGYYDINIREDYIPNMINLIEENISDLTIKKNAFHYLETLIRLIRNEDNNKYKKEMKNIKKICSKNQYLRVKSRTN